MCTVHSGGFDSFRYHQNYFRFYLKLNLVIIDKDTEKKTIQKNKNCKFSKNFHFNSCIMYWLGKIHSLCTVCRILNNLCSILYGGRNWCRLSNELTQQNCSKILHCTVVKGVKLTHSITAWSRRRYRYLTTYYILY